MGRESAYPALRRALERQVAAGQRISLTRAADTAHCDRTTASRLYHHGLSATQTSAALPPLREALGIPTTGALASAADLDPDQLLLQDVRGGLSTIMGQATRVLTTLVQGTDPASTLDTLDRLTKILAALAAALDRLAAVSKSLGGRKPPAPRAPAAAPPPAESDAEVRARLDALAEEMGDGDEPGEDAPQGYDREVGGEVTS